MATEAAVEASFLFGSIIIGNARCSSIHARSGRSTRSGSRTLRLDDPVEFSLAMEENAIGLFGFLSRGLPGSWVKRGEKLTAYFTGLPHPMFNAVMRAQLENDVAEESVARILSSFKQRGVPFTWMVGPSSTPQRLPQILEDEGLRREEDDLPGMVLDLAEVDGEALTQAVDRSGVLPRRVQTDQDARDWMKAFSDVFPLPEPVIHAMGEMVNRAKDMGNAARLVNYVGTLDGEPVGLASVFVSGNVAGVYNVGTVEEQRGKGIGTAMTLASVLDGRRRGCRVAVLQSSKVGFPVYARMGFRQSCRCAVYVWTS